MELTEYTSTQEALDFIASPEVREKLSEMRSGAKAELEKRIKRTLDSLHDLDPNETLPYLAKKNFEGVLWFFKGQRK